MEEEGERQHNRPFLIESTEFQPILYLELSEHRNIAVQYSTNHCSTAS